MELILDYSKWRCGGAEETDEAIHVLGHGSTRLLNTEGYMCCLGQFALQLGFSKGEIIHDMRPCNLRKQMGIFNVKARDRSFYDDTELASSCIHINDDPSTTPAEKIHLLTNRLAKENIQLKVINLPHDK